MVIRLKHFVFGFFFAASPLLGAKKEPPPPPPPPMPLAQSVSLYRGHSVEIPLGAIGRAPDQLRFLIRNPPKNGTLGKITFIDRKNATITYTHNDKPGAVLDSFTYAVQGPDTPVSAPAQVSITVSEEPPSLVATPLVDFGRVWAGETLEGEVTLNNVGGAVLSGTMEVGAPWKIVGSNEYRLARREELKVKLLFAPREEQQFSGRLVLSHDGKIPILLSGTAVAPLVFEPSRELEIKGTARAAELTVQNRTEKPRTAALTYPGHVEGPAEVQVPPQSSVKVPLRAARDYLGEISGDITLRSENFQTTLPLRVFAMPASLALDPAGPLAFGQVPAGQTLKSKLTVRNVGGLPAQLKSDTPSEILLVPEPESVVLAPGEQRTLEISFEAPPKAGPWTGEIALATGDTPPVKLTVTAESTVEEKPVAPAQRAAEIAAKIARPAPLPGPKVIEQDFGPLNEIPPIQEVTPLDASTHHVEFSWKKPATNATSYKVEWRQIEPGENDTVRIRWNPWQGGTFTEKDGMVVAHFDDLRPGYAWYIRIRTVDDTGRASAPSGVIRIATEPIPPFHLPWWITLILCVAAAYGLRRAWQWYQKQRNSEDADRLSRLEHT